MQLIHNQFSKLVLERLRTVVFLCLIFSPCENRSYTPAEINANKEYLTTLCNTFRAAFEMHTKTPRPAQYAVLTLGKVENIPPDNINCLGLPFQHPTDDWNAWYVGYRVSTDITHMEKALMNSVSSMLQGHIDRKIAQNNNLKVTTLKQLLPMDMYLYTYLIPCLDVGHECTYVVINAVDKDIPNALKNILSMQKYSRIVSDKVNINELLKELQEMTFWLAWTNSNWGSLEKQKKTWDIFNKRVARRRSDLSLNFKHFIVDDNCAIQRISENS